jgi:hypothetical protein
VKRVEQASVQCAVCRVKQAIEEAVESGAGECEERAACSVQSGASESAEW